MDSIWKKNFDALPPVFAACPKWILVEPWAWTNKYFFSFESLTKMPTRSNIVKRIRQLGVARSVLQTEVIPKGQCLVRGGPLTGRRNYFAIFNSTDECMRSTAFVRRYGDIKFYDTSINLNLLYIPYVSLFDATPQEVKEGKLIMSYLMKRARGNEQLETCILQLFDEDEFGCVYTNPDYPVANLLCDLGFDGWIRKANRMFHTPADEVFLCQTKGRVKPSSACNCLR